MIFLNEKCTKQLAQTVEKNAKCHSNQPREDLFTAETEKKKEEEINQQSRINRCTMQCVQNAVMTARSHSNPPREDLFTAKSAIKNVEAKNKSSENCDYLE